MCYSTLGTTNQARERPGGRGRDGTADTLPGPRLLCYESVDGATIFIKTGFSYVIKF